MENTHKLIDDLMRPEVAASITNCTRLATARAKALIDSSIRNHPAIYAMPQVQDRLTIGIMNSPDFARALHRSWTRFTTGR